MASGSEALAEYQRALDEWRLLTGSALVGLVEETMNIAAEFAKTRYTLGVPISTLQAISHPLANIAITTVGFTATSMAFPLMLYAQGVRGLSPTEAALLLAPMAVISGVLAPVVGRLTDRHHPRYVAGIGLVCFPVALAWLAAWSLLAGRYANAVHRRWLERRGYAMTATELPGGEGAR